MAYDTERFTDPPDSVRDAAGLDQGASRTVHLYCAAGLHGVRVFAASAGPPGKRDAGFWDGFSCGSVSARRGRDVASSMT